jgi:DnaK suppressor protein
MRKRDLEAARRALLEKQQWLQGLARDALDQDLDILEGERSDEVDLASAETLQDFALRLRTRERHLAHKIRMALERIEDGSFGICEECDEPIGAARMLARPEATLCIQCKEQQEQFERGYVH